MGEVTITIIDRDGGSVFMIVVNTAVIIRETGLKVIRCQGPKIFAAEAYVRSTVPTADIVKQEVRPKATLDAIS